MSWLAVARVLREHTAQINSLDFSKDGELLLSSGDDARLSLYSTTQGVPQRVAVCAQHGAELARFTHDPMSVIMASPTDYAVRAARRLPRTPGAFANVARAHRRYRRYATCPSMITGICAASARTQAGLQRWRCRLRR